MTEPTLQKALVPQGPPKSSPLLDRVRALPGGDDLYALVEVKSLRPIIGPLAKAAAAQPEQWISGGGAAVSGGDRPGFGGGFVGEPHERQSDGAGATRGQRGERDRLEELYRMAKDMQRKQAIESSAVLRQSQDPIERAFGNYIERASQAARYVQIERRGREPGAV